MSPTLKARRKPLNKTEIEDTVHAQFPPKSSHAANMYDRAIKIYEKQKETQGFKMKEMGKPNEVFHAHIEAMDDRIAVSRYPIEMQIQFEDETKYGKQPLKTQKTKKFGISLDNLKQERS